MPARQSSARRRNGGSRDELVALNADPELTRDAVCRLAARPDVVRRPVADDAAAEDGLRVPRRQLEIARRTLRDAAASAARERRRADRHGARILTWLDPDYPAVLLELELPPPVLYCRGRIPAPPCLAIVGSRAASRYARDATTLFATAVASAGVPIVSGFARGVDVAAHRGALEADGGLTVAVLGCGLDVAYPQAHNALKDSIAARGAVVTELPMGCPPLAHHFPVRNRIIAALAVATLVTEAAPRSGSLITVRHALELGRDVFALPGRVFDQGSIGTNSLIRDGAFPVQHPNEILECLGIDPPGRPGQGRPPAGEAGTLWAHLEAAGERTVEELAAHCSLAPERALSLLLELELQGHVERLPGALFAATSRLSGRG